MAEKVKMTVECLGQFCQNCPELEIETDRLHLTDGYDGYYVNHLHCKHLDKCEGIYLLMKQDWENHHVTRLEHSHK